MAIRQIRNGFKITGSDANEFMRQLKAKIEPEAWVEAGYLGNGHCPFMRGSFSGPSCTLAYGHEGAHSPLPEYRRGTSGEKQ